MRSDQQPTRGEVIFKNTLTAAAITLGSMAVGLGIGGGIDLLGNLRTNRGHSDQELNNAIRDNELQQQILVDNSNALNTLQKQLGESCITALNPYKVGEALAKTSERDAVEYISSDPNKPCGDTNKTEIVIKLTNYRLYTSEIAEAKPASKKASKELAKVKNNRKEDEENLLGFTLARITALVGLGGFILKKLDDKYII